MYKFLYYQRLNKKLNYQSFLYKTSSLFFFNFYNLLPIEIEHYKTLFKALNFTFLKCDFSFFKNFKNFQFFKKTKNLLISETLYVVFPNIKNNNLKVDLNFIFNQNNKLLNMYLIGFLNYNLILDKNLLISLLNFKYVNKINLFIYSKNNLTYLT